MTDKEITRPDISDAEDRITDIKARISDDDPNYGALAGAVVLVLRQQMWDSKKMAAMPEQITTMVLTRLNGQIKASVSQGLRDHEERCAEIRKLEAEAEHDCEDADVSTFRKMLGYLVLHNAKVAGAVIITLGMTAMIVCREPFNAWLMKLITGG